MKKSNLSQAFDLITPSMESQKRMFDRMKEKSVVVYEQKRTQKILLKYVLPIFACLCLILTALLLFLPKNEGPSGENKTASGVLIMNESDLNRVLQTSKNEKRVKYETLSEFQSALGYAFATPEDATNLKYYGYGNAFFMKFQQNGTNYTLAFAKTSEEYVLFEGEIHRTKISQTSAQTIYYFNNGDRFATTFSLGDYLCYFLTNQTDNQTEIETVTTAYLQQIQK